MNTTMIKPANLFPNLLAGEFDFVALAPETLLVDADRRNILATLDETPYTFEYEGMPSCWGKGFENYPTLAEYLAPHILDVRIAELCKPIHQRLVQMLENQGIQVMPLIDTASQTHYTLGNFRRTNVPQNSTMLHVDDLTLDGNWKPDFALPAELQGEDYKQLMVMVMLDATDNTGILRSYDRRYQATDAQYLLANAWQFADAAVAEASHHDYRPQTGDAIIMANQYYHDILGGTTDSTWLYYSIYILHVPSRGIAWLYI
jgi:hypothetical protein